VSTIEAPSGAQIEAWLTAGRALKTERPEPFDGPAPLLFPQRRHWNLRNSPVSRPRHAQAPLPREITTTSEASSQTDES
jgi:hypothetical protein